MIGEKFMILPSIKDLERIKETNNTSDKEWKIITKYLTTGTCDSYNDALICHNNMIKNEEWYNNNLYHTLKYAFENSAVSDLTFKISSFVKILFNILTPASTLTMLLIGIYNHTLYDPSIFVILSICYSIIGAICEVFLLHQLSSDGIAKIELNHLKRKLKHILNKAQKKNYTRISISLEKENNNSEKQIETKKEYKNDLYLNEISKLLDKVLKYQYQGFSQDVYDLARMARSYRFNKYYWFKLDEATKTELMSKVVDMETEINKKISEVIKQQYINIQTQKLIIDKINSDLGSDFLSNYQEESSSIYQQTSDNELEEGPKLSLSKNKNPNNFKKHN